ncbi:hypothetical protein LDENG_00203180 [Lucifuga dentata]|nr:hypothetical protein LDENG_00203180 [Lucifuga dentata]
MISFWICCHFIYTQVKSEVEQKTGKNYRVFKAVKYRSQVVEGVNYFIKVNVGEGDYLHLIVFQSLPCYGGKIELIKVQEHKTEDDPIEPF